MAAEFIMDGDNVTIRMEWTVPLEKGQRIVGKCAESQWKEELDDEGVVLNPFSGASNQEKLDVAYKYAQRSVVDIALSFAQKQLRMAANDGVDPADYSLGE